MNNKDSLTGRIKENLRDLFVRDKDGKDIAAKVVGAGVTGGVAIATMGSGDMLSDMGIAVMITTIASFFVLGTSEYNDWMDTSGYMLDIWSGAAAATAAVSLYTGSIGAAILSTAAAFGTHVLASVAYQG